MGQAVAAPADEFPWFQILQWATEDLKTSEMFVYDLKAVRAAIEKDWENEDAVLAAEENLSLRCDEDSAEEVWVSWAQALLEISPKLADLRFSLVPKKISEEVFWAKIFSAAKLAVLTTI